MDKSLDIITKTLYIQIDETPMPEMPELLAKMVPTVDCRLMNDFYSCFGAALCGDLTAPDGRKLYRLIKPAGRILAEYAASDGSAEAMADLRKQWYDLLVTILDGTCAPTFTFTLPTHFLKWLKHNLTNNYYPLLATRSQITLPTDDIDADIRSHAGKIIAKALEKDTTCVFSNPKLYISNIVYYWSFQTTTYNKWEAKIQLLKHETLKKTNSPIAPDDISLDGCVLGKANWFTFAWLGATEGSGDHKPFEYLNYKGAQIWFKDGIWEHTYVTHDDSYPFEKFFTQITGLENSPKCCFDYIYFSAGDWDITRLPTTDSDGWFRAEIKRTIGRYLYVLSFLKKLRPTYFDKYPRETIGTLYSITIKSIDR